MLSFNQFLLESIVKNKWTLLNVHNETDLNQELINLVDLAYQQTTLGSFVKSIKDVQQSEWVVLDWNDDPYIDIAIFYRNARSGEKWNSKKIQGIGHNNEYLSKKKLLDKLETLLTNGGWWLEASDNLAKSLLKRINPITDKRIISSIFTGIQKFNEDGSYDRLINDKIHTEFIFGDLK